VVHRDIKPANIMLTAEGRVKIADFGVAWIESSTMTQVGARIGTPAYMSPEQHQGLPVTRRSDLFSVGVILYQFLTGERPFSGSGYPLIQQIFWHHPAPPSQSNPDLPPPLDAVTMRALAKRPEDRFPSARAFAEAFRHAATSESTGTLVDDVASGQASPPPSLGAAPGDGADGDSKTMLLAATRDDTSSQSDVSLAAELEYWKELKDSTEAADFEMFLQLFPQSRFAPLARRRMKAIVSEDAPTMHLPALAMGLSAGTAPSDAERAFTAASELPFCIAGDGSARTSDAPPGLDESDAGLAMEGSADDGMAPAREEGAVQGRRKTRSRERDRARARRRRRVEESLRRTDAVEPKLVFPLATDPGDIEPAQDPSVERIESPAFAANASSRVHGPVHARQRTPNSAPASSRPSQTHAHRIAHKPRALPLMMVLAAAVAGSGIWFASRPEWTPVVMALRAKTQAFGEMLVQQWQAAEAGPAHSAQAAGQIARPREAAPDDAPQPERNAQSDPAQEKKEAARAAADRNYERALALLHQGRSSAAVHQLRQLAYAGHGPAAKALGDIYSRGEDVLLDMGEAAHFYAMAERNGVKIDR
jgi:serine/threonine-protein kinase